MTNQQSPSATMTVEAAARVLGIGRAAAYAAVRRGQLPVLVVGRRYLVPRARLDDLLGISGRNAEPVESGQPEQ